MIRVENLCKRYGDFTAVHNISFQVEKGEIVGFLGPNGAGKTTTMRILTGYMPASEGTVKVAGFDVFEEDLEVKKRVGYLPEHPPVYNDMTVRGYLNFVSKIRGLSRAVRSGAVDRVIERCSLDGVRDKIIGKLSKGFKQRVGLAQALVHNPDVLVLDEPTIGLDPRQIREIRSLIHELAGDHTVILSTHILTEVEMICERLLIIDMGRVVLDGNLAALTQDSSLEEVFLKATQMDREVSA